MTIRAMIPDGDRSVRMAGLTVLRLLRRVGSLVGQRLLIDFFDWIDETAGARIEPFRYIHSDRTDAEDLATLVRLVETGRLHPEIGVTAMGPHSAGHRRHSRPPAARQCRAASGLTSYMSTL